MSTATYFPAVEDIIKASKVLEEILEPTPFKKNDSLSELFDAQVFLKREDLQMVRSYKIRGAYNKIRSISPDRLANGIVCASAGNHAQGVAFSCNKLKIKGSIYMPTTTPRQKIDSVRMFGRDYVDIVLTGDTFDAANSAAIEYARQSGKTFIPPFDDQKIIEGQGTIGYEILQQAKQPLDYIFVPIGGGGLASGIGSYIKRMSPSTKVIGVEPAGAPCMKTAIEKGEIVELEHIDKFVDGAAVKKAGALTYEICKSVLDDIITTIDKPDMHSAILYASDHGENVAPGDILRSVSTTPKPSEYHVPMMIWRSQQWIASNPAKHRSIDENKDLPTSADNIYYTLCDLANIHIPHHHKTRSMAVTSPSLQPHKRRLLTSDLKTVITLTSPDPHTP